MVKGGVGSRSARHPMMKHEYFKQLIVAFYSHASAIKKTRLDVTQVIIIKMMMISSSSSVFSPWKYHDKSLLNLDRLYTHEIYWT